MNKKYVSLAIGLMSVASLAVALPAFAQSNDGGQGQQAGEGSWQGRGNPGGPMMRVGGGNIKPGVFGTVSAISGNTLSVTSKQVFGLGRKASTTPAVSVVYSVDATNATVFKNNATSSLSAIVVGDTVMAQGTLTGTNLVATTIRDGLPTMMRGNKNPNADNNGQQNGADDGKNNATTTPKRGMMGNFFGGIGSFFGHLFGF